MPTLNLFPTPLWLNQLESAEFEPLNRELLSLFESIRREQGYEQGARWQTPNDLQKRPEMAPFLEVARRFCLQSLEQINVVNKDFIFTGCWANIKPHAGAHQAHTHPNNYLSGVYYVTAPPKCGSIVFHDPRNDPYIVAPLVSGPNPFNSRFVNFEPKVGMCLLFPSWLMHSVEPNQSDSDRISISFNMMFSDFAQSVAAPGW